VTDACPTGFPVGAAKSAKYGLALSKGRSKLVLIAVIILVET
jgi:hypothetical protein